MSGDATQPFATLDGKPTRFLLQRINALRVTATQPTLSVYTTIADRMGKPTPAIMKLLNELTGTAPKASETIIYPETGYPTKRFLELVND
jgi:hypothetical protein